MPLLIPSVGCWPARLLSSRSICELRSNRALLRADPWSNRFWPSCSNDRMPRVMSESSARRQLTCFSNCLTRQLSRSGPGARGSTVKLIDLILFPDGTAFYPRVGKARRWVWVDSWLHYLPQDVEVFLSETRLCHCGHLVLSALHPRFLFRPSLRWRNDEVWTHHLASQASSWAAEWLHN